MNALCVLKGLLSRAAVLLAMVVLPVTLSASTSTTTTLALLQNGSPVASSNVGHVLSLSVTVTAMGTAVSPGQVLLCDAPASRCADIHRLGVAQLKADGTAQFAFLPSAGTHVYAAVFLGTNAYGSSVSPSVPLTVTGSGSTSSTVDLLFGNDFSFGHYSFNSTLAANGPVAPTGALKLIDANHGNAVLGTQPLNALIAGLNLSSLAVPYDAFYDAILAVADFNNDGLADLAVSSHAIRILLSNGDGTFREVESPNLTIGSRGIATGDFNADGIQDIALSGYNEGEAAILLGNGDGTFRSGQQFPATGDAYTEGLVSASDLNGDGIVDLIDNGRYFIGNGDGSFTLSSAPVPNAKVPLLLTAPPSGKLDDFNGDGILDQVRVAGPDVQVFLCGATGDCPLSSSFASGYNGGSAQSADVNGDGIADIVYIQSSPALFKVFFGKGDGTFTAGPVTVNQYAGGGVLGDFDQDGNLDIAVVGTGGPASTAILFGAGDGTFPRVSSLVDSYLATALPGHFTLDGRTGIVTMNYDAFLQLILTQSGYTQTAAFAGTFPIGEEHTLKAQYDGDSNYTPSASATQNITLFKTQTLLRLLPVSATVEEGTSIPFTVQLTYQDAEGHSVVGQIIALYSGSTMLQTAPIANASYDAEDDFLGTATFNVTLPVGISTLTARYAGDADFMASTSNAVMVTVNSKTSRATTTVIMLSVPFIAIGQTVTVSASVSSMPITNIVSGGVVSFYDNGGLIASAGVSNGVANLQYTPSALGQHRITSTFQPAGGQQFLASSDSFGKTLTVQTITPNIQFAVPEHTFGDPTFFLAATSNSPAAISYVVLSGPGEIFGQRLKINGAGIIAVQAKQVATGNFGAGARNTSFAVTKATQTITFQAPPGVATVGANPIALGATASSGLPVTFTVLSGPAFISDSRLTLTGPGTVVVGGQQPGTSNYFASERVNHQITVHPQSMP